MYDEKKIDPVLVNRAVSELKSKCAKLEKELHEVVICCNALSKLLDHAVFDDGMIRQETIVFHGETKEFLELLYPFFTSLKWKVNDAHKYKTFFRALDEVVKIKYDEKQDYLKFDSLMTALKEYLEIRRIDDSFS